MALVIDLKPGEKILIGTAVITNDTQRTRLHISGEAAILREKDVMREEEADTPCKKVYFLIQCMYMSKEPQEYYTKYFDLIRDIQKAAAHTAFMFLAINEKIIEGSYYKAMREARELIKLEEEMIGHVNEQQAQPAA